MARSAIRTPDQRLRVFVSSTLVELAPERRAVRAAVEQLRLAPVMFELGARPHPPRALYRSYLEQSDVFLAVYWQSYDDAVRHLDEACRTLWEGDPRWLIASARAWAGCGRSPASRCSVATASTPRRRTPPCARCWGASPRVSTRPRSCRRATCSLTPPPGSVPA